MIRVFLLLALAALSSGTALAQCGKIVVNPLNGLLDCTGTDTGATGPQGPAGPAAAWGSIPTSPPLSSQTDLQAALNLKANLASPSFTGTVTVGTLTGVLLGTSGVLSVVTGTATDCVKVNGTSGACGSGGGTITLSGDVSGSGTSAITTVIGAGVVTNAMLAGSIAASKLIGTDIVTVGTVATGTWNATAISAAKGGTGGSSAASSGIAHVATGTWTYSPIVGSDIASATIDLTSKVTGTLPVGNGGTGVTSFTASRCLESNASGTGIVVASAACGGAAAPVPNGFVTFTTGATTATITHGFGLAEPRGIVPACFEGDATSAIRIWEATFTSFGTNSVVANFPATSAAGWCDANGGSGGTGGSGSGSVTTVSVVTANGISGSVANATTTPAITLTLGNITPTTVNKVTITQPASGSTLTIADGKTLQATNTLTLSSNDGVTVNFGAGGTATLLGGTVTGTLGAIVLSQSPTIDAPVITGIADFRATMVVGIAGSVVGTIGLKNGTSGSITLTPTTGALGSAVVTLPAVTGTAAVATTSTTATQALFATATAGAPGYRAIATADLPAALSSQTSINGLGITGSTGTLTITNAKTFSVSNTLTFTGTDGSSVAFGAGGTPAYVGLANTWTAGVKQAFAPNATNAGLNIGSVSGAPSSLANADMWYDTGTNKFKCRENGATVDCIQAGTGSGTVNSGTAGQLGYYASSTTAISGNPNATISGGNVTLGVAGTTVGTLNFGNATSGTVQLTPPTGALGSTVLTFQALTGKVPTFTVTPTNGDCVTWVVSGGTSGLGNAACGATGGYTYNAVTFSATPTFTVATTALNVFKITLTGNVTSSTVSGGAAGQEISLIICQDGTGSRTFVPPTSFKGAFTIGSTASTCSVQNYAYDGTNFWATSTGAVNL